MVQYGTKTGLYLQSELLPKIDQILAKNQDIYKSRNHFINCAIIKEIRRFDNNATLHRHEEAAES